MKRIKNDKKLFSIDFSKMDDAIKALLSSIIEIDNNKFKQQKSDSNRRETTSNKHFKKKLNVDMIREILIKAKETAKQNKNNN